jgi:ABC-type dipeptide/oligopeptide/nickel transport system ATPase component
MSEGTVAMKGLTFASFVTDENNQAAYDICKRIANLEKGSPRLLTIVGEKGTGKSHLLWAIVNHFRANQARVGMALISANDFPAKVKRLINDPAPIQKNRDAVLLIDELDSFKDESGDLESVARAFIDNGHIVVAASRVHPSALPLYSGKFKALLNNGTVVGMQAAGTADEDGGLSDFAMDRITALKETIEHLEKDRRRLQDELARTAASASQGGDLSEALLKAESERDRMRTALERSEGDLFEANADLSAIRESEQETRSELESAANAVAALSARLADDQAAQRKRIAALEETLTGLSKDLEFLAADAPAAGDPATTAFDALAGEKHAIETRYDETQALLTKRTNELEAAREESAKAAARATLMAGELQGMVSRANSLLTEGDRSSIREAREVLNEALEKLDLETVPMAMADDEDFESIMPSPKRSLPGGDALQEVVKKAFGDPLEDDDDDDFTHVEPELDSDDGLPPLDENE